MGLIGAPRLAADIGGTFTDVVLDAGGRSFTAKVLTTHGAPADGVLDGVRRVLREADVQPSAVGAVIHGTTLAANAIIERRGARTALLVTEGHRDALETGYENRFDQYDITLSKPVPLVPRGLRWPVMERISASGSVLRPLDESAVEALIARLQAEKIESVAVGFLHSYANPQHEQRVAEILKAEMPELWISLSSDVSPQIREYDRLSTAAANAYVQPLMASYLHDLDRRLLHEGFECPLLLVMSTGGLTTVDAAVRFPVRLVESGPAGGAILASEVARRSGFDKVVAFDMGGTTAKLCLIDDGAPQYADSFEVDRIHRFVRGSGLPLRIPTIEMVEIGAGGGSIASIDTLGRLRMGPQSAGSDPGPACYGRGGSQATVTDADFLLGRLEGRGFAGGLLDLRLDAARDAVMEHVGRLLSIEAVPAAAAMSEIVDEAMANAARVHAVESGKDVSNRTLIAFGGAAPLHAVRVAEKLGISRVVIPADAGVGSAVGFLLAPVSFEVTRTWLVALEQVTSEGVAAVVGAMFGPAKMTVRRAAPEGELAVELKAYMRYAAQGHEVEVSLPIDAALIGGPQSPGGSDRSPEISLLSRPAIEGSEKWPTAATFLKAFEQRYLSLYGRLIPNVPVNLVALAIRVTALRPPRATEIATATPPAPRTLTPIPTPIPNSTNNPPTYLRASLNPGTSFPGPAIITERQTTTIIPPKTKVTIDPWHNIVIERETRQ